MNRNLHAGKNLSAGFSLGGMTTDELYEIHLATLEVLEKTGIFIGHAEARELFDGAGAGVDPKTGMVNIPPYLVEDAIRSAPSKILLAGRDPRHDRVLESNRVHFTNFSEGVQINDPFTGERRVPVYADLENAARVIDYLDEIDVCEKALGASDVPPAVVPLYNSLAFLSNTTKHCPVGPGDGFLLKRLVAMAAEIAGGRNQLLKRPVLSFCTCPVSPLKLIDECCDILVESARAGIPVNILSMAMAGGTAPIHLAGTLVTHNAEVLGGLVLTQIARRGAPVIYGSSTTAMDLRMAAAAVGTPECAMISGAVARLARYYALPSYVAGG